jgi:hypothetical protein
VYVFRSPSPLNRKFDVISDPPIIGGDHFTELKDQKALLEVLKYTDIEHAWPTTQIQERLKHSWGWI